jgi:hypothetical protein
VILYTLTVAVEDDDTTDERTEERELAAQLRLAAHAVTNGSAPVPGDAPKLLTGGGLAARATTYLSAVTL